MNRKAILKKTKEFVKQSFKGAEGGHDWFHTKRVLENSVHIAREENANLFVVQLAALLHDIADSFFITDKTKYLSTSCLSLSARIYL